MSVTRLKCSCGAEFEVRAFLVREVEIQWWLDLHRRCQPVPPVRSLSETEEKPAR